jgi:hypothetical protein
MSNTAYQVAFFTVWAGAYGWGAWLQARAVRDAMHSGLVKTGRTVGRVVYRSSDQEAFRAVLIRKTVWGAVLLATGLLPLIAFAVKL